MYIVGLFLLMFGTKAWQMWLGIVLALVASLPNSIDLWKSRKLDPEIRPSISGVIAITALQIVIFLATTGWALYLFITKF
jgi:hypothetical protein